MNRHPSTLNATKDEAVQDM